MIVRLAAYLAPIVAGLIVPFLLSRECPHRWVHSGLAVGSLSILLLLVALFGGVPFAASMLLVAYIVAIAVFFAGIFESFRFLSRAGAQIVCGLILAAMAASMFLSNLLLENADTKREVERVVSLISNASPIAVVGTILADDPAHRSVMYSVSRLADYGIVRADLPLLFLFLFGVGGLLLAIAFARVLIRKKNGPSPVLPTNPVQAPR